MRARAWLQAARAGEEGKGLEMEKDRPNRHSREKWE